MTNNTTYRGNSNNTSIQFFNRLIQNYPRSEENRRFQAAITFLYQNRQTI